MAQTEIDYIRALESALQDFEPSYNHPRWTSPGKPVAVGDFGEVGPDHIRIQVAAIDGETGMIRDTDGVEWRFADCATFVSRSGLPKQRD